MIAIIDYNAGNVKSVKNALSKLGCESIITDDSSIISSAEKIILPGVGEASTAMRHLRDKGLDITIKGLKQPVLGICLGLQLMCRFSDEGMTHCLGIFNSFVRRFPPLDKIPHMGWNNLDKYSGPLFRDFGVNDNVYFVHSYFSDLCGETTAVSNYIIPFSSALQKDNFYATQFHPEKSGLTGEKILKNFIEL